MGFFWTQQLETAVNANTAPLVTAGTFDVRVLLMVRAPLLTQESAQIAAYRTVTTVADLLSRPGWEEVSDPSYVRGTNTGCSRVVQGANTFVQLGQTSTSFALAEDTQVEAVVLAVSAAALGLAGTDLYVLFGTDTPFRQSEATVLRNGDALTARLDSYANARWFFGWALSGGSFSGLAEGPISLLTGAPTFESSRIQKAWMFPQRVNYVANPSFEYTAGWWQSNKGALTQVTESSGYPSAKVGYVSGSAATSPVPQYATSERLYIRSAKFFPTDRLMTFQLMAKGRGIVRVGLATYSQDYMQYDADWGMGDDLIFEEWELSPDRYTRMTGIRTMHDLGYEAALLIEVRGYLSDPNNFSTYQYPYASIDQALVEEGALLDWPYFDGDETYGAPEDHLWYGAPTDAKQGKSYSLWYNNRRDINGRLFGRRVDDTALYTSRDEQLDSMISGWVPAGVSVIPQWGALAVNDTLVLPPDNSASTLSVSLWPEKSQYFEIVEVVAANPSSITLKVVGEGGSPISRAFVRSNSTIYTATISARPWEQPGLRAYQIDALKAELYDLSKAQLVTITWPAIPAFNSNTLYIERGDSRSPQSFIAYTLQQAAGSGFGSGSGEGFDAVTTVAPRVAAISATGAASPATTAYGALAATAEGVGTAYIPGLGSTAAAELATATGQGTNGLAQIVFPFPAGAASGTGTAFTATTTVSFTSDGADSVGSAAQVASAVNPTGLTSGIGVGAADNASVVKNDAPNPVTSLSGSYQTSGTDSWSAYASWTLPGDPDIGDVQIRWTIGGTVGSWISLTGTATSHTQAATSGVTHTAEVRTVDTNSQVSTTTPSVALGSSPLNAVPSLTVSQTALDQITATWTHPSGNNRSGYTVTITDGVTPSTTTEASTTTSKTWTLATNTSFTVTVTPLDNTSGTRSGRSKSGSASTTAPAPASPYLTAWTYSSVDLTWSAVSLAATYEVERAVSGGAYSVIATGLTTTSYTASGLSQDTNYRFRIRAKGVSNFGTYSTEVRPAIGHPASSYTQAWSATNSSVNIYRDRADGVYVPANVVTSTMTVALTTNGNFSAVMFYTPGSGSSRLGFFVVADSFSFGVPYQSNPWNQSFSFVQNTTGLAGVIATGSGWSTSPTGTQRVVGTITVTGTETVYVSEVTNSYW